MMFEQNVRKENEEKPLTCPWLAYALGERAGLLA